MRRCLVVAVVNVILIAAVACRRETAPAPPVDHPRLSPAVELRDVTFHSASLNRDMPYRAILPKEIPSGQKLPVLYLLHGGGGNYRDWSNYSDIAGYATRGWVLVMPEGDSSYYMNAVGRSQDRYEDYIVKDLVTDVESRFPAASGREHRAIAGVSMGGFGAVVLAMRHPDLYSFAAGISPALDVPSRPFTFQRWDQWWRYRAIFGPTNGAVRKGENPFSVATSVDPAKTPYLFLTCGDHEGLLAPNQRFAKLLSRRGFHFEFHKTMGGFHDWRQWNQRVPSLMESVAQHTH